MLSDEPGGCSREANIEFANYYEGKNSVSPIVCHLLSANFLTNKTNHYNIISIEWHRRLYYLICAIVFYLFIKIEDNYNKFEIIGFKI